MSSAPFTQVPLAAAGDGAFDPGADANTLLDLLAWLATAAGVAGVLTVGTLMTLALRRGEGAENLKQFGFVLGACVLAATAGPLVTALGTLKIA
ncbi:hypothetical protein [Wenjunlia tyrosinilytica]|uniref:TrbC/VIRB2 family protein n=1 Tax=Wenjunlia tyrosinilytica TaxID=1544741 RepID=A0A917ZWN8_9ACTN|nr:hypothetical protein [Wenjunlia tyrosinilytica]GGO95751.1 hypothetical protein GCM10012280_53670 [Wenjunlia tyrosinilytica]